MLDSIPNFFTFTDYRLLMKECFHQHKSARSTASLQSVADKIGISKSYLKMIMDQERHLSMEKISIFAKIFKFNNQEKNFFYFLYLENQIQDPELKTLFLNMQRLSPNISDFSSMEIAQQISNKITFKSALHMILSSIKRFSNFKKDSAWVARQLHDKTITDDEVTSALKDMENTTNDFVQWHALTPDFSMYNIGLKMAEKSLGQPTVFKPCQFYMMSLSLDLESERIAFKEFVALKEKLIDLSNKAKDPSSVIYVSNNMFCVADKKE
jgi:AraC-like DNA-binding protein